MVKTGGQQNNVKKDDKNSGNDTENEKLKAHSILMT